MAFVVDPIWGATIKFLDAAGKTASMSFNVRVGAGGATEAEARAKVLSVASAAQAISCAMVQSTVLRAQADDVAGQVPPEGGASDPYKTIEDRIRLRLGDSAGDKRTPICLPAPKAAILSGDKENADSANAALQALLSFLADQAVSYGKRKLLEYIDGKRERGKTITLPPGHGYQIAP